MKRSELAQHRRFTVGMIFQSFNLIPSRTAMENVALALAFGGVRTKDRKLRAMDGLSRVGLKERVDHTPGELSGGEAQRVAIARALANKPDILLADEPTGNLDSTTSSEIIRLLERLNEEGLTILMVTHDVSSAEAVSHRMFRLLDGRIIDEKSMWRPS
jgi:putative ABC transport system ATP-binding protein